MNILSKIKKIKEQKPVVEPEVETKTESEVEAKTRKQEYAEYCKSDRFKELTAERFAVDNHDCRACGNPAQVAHHIRYPKILGTETIADLTSLCNKCHHNYHKPPGLKEVREELHGRIRDDEVLSCPVCDQFCKMYNRKLDSGMAASLCWMVSAYSGDWIEVQKVAPRHVIRTNKHGKLFHWGLVISMSNDSDSSRKQLGMWKPTQAGIDFANGIISVPKYTFVYNNTLLGVSDEQTTIREALGDKFDYAELMKPAPLNP